MSCGGDEGGILFCPHCDSLLDTYGASEGGVTSGGSSGSGHSSSSSSARVRCGVCNFSASLAKLPGARDAVVTKSDARPEPRWYRQWRTANAEEEEEEKGSGRDEDVRSDGGDKKGSRGRKGRKGKGKGDEAGDDGIVRATIDEPCPACGEVQAFLSLILSLSLTNEQTNKRINGQRNEQTDKRSN